MIYIKKKRVKAEVAYMTGPAISFLGFCTWGVGPSVRPPPCILRTAREKE